MKKVLKQEYENFLKNYKGETVQKVITIVEPPFEATHDKVLLKKNGNKFSIDSIIAQKSMEDEPEYYIKS